MRLPAGGRAAQHAARVAFSTVEFIATAATGGLLGGFVQQFVQWRMGLTQRRTEDERRTEDRQHALADRLTAQRESRYVDLLGAVARYSTALDELDGLLRTWLDVLAIIEADEDPAIQDGVRVAWSNAPDWAGPVFTRYDVARDDVIDAVNAALPIASAAARTLFDPLETHPPIGMLRMRILDPGLTDESVPSTVPQVVARLADGPAAVRLVDKLRATCTELDVQLRKELALD